MTSLHVKVDVANIGSRDGDEVVQVYFRHVKSAVPQPVPGPVPAFSACLLP